MPDEEVKSEIVEPDDGSVSAEIDDPLYVEPEEEEKEEKQEESKEPEEKAEEKEPEEKETEPEEKKPDEVEALKKELEANKKEIARLGYALRTGKKEEKKADEPAFTDAQLLAIMKEHKDDPTVMLQVFKEVANQKGKEIELSAEKAVDIKTKTGEFEKFLSTAFPNVMNEATPEFETVEKAVDWLHLEGHPFGKYLAVATMQFRALPDLIKKVQDDTRKEVLSKKADDTRKDKIKSNLPPGSGEKSTVKAPTLSPTQMETAKKLFGNDKKAISRYAKMLTRQGGSYTVSA